MKSSNNNQKDFYKTFQPDFDSQISKIKSFLQDFKSNLEETDKKYGKKKYMIQLQKISNREQTILEIHTEDLKEYLSKDNKASDLALLDAILNNTKRYVNLFSDVVDEIMPNPSKQLPADELLMDKNDIIQRHRSQNMANLPIEEKDKNARKNIIPKELRRRYELFIVNGPGEKANTVPLRQLKAKDIGSLQTVKGIVVKCTDVKPFLKVASYSCDICGCETYQVNNGRTYMPLIDCQSEQCRNNHSHGEIMQINRASKFLSFQEVTIQEPTYEVPTGHVPRSIKIYCFGSTTRQCVPGDVIKVTGVYLPRIIDDVRFKNRLIHDTYIEAYKIVKEKKNYKDIQTEQEMIKTLSKDPKNNTLYQNLSKSIAPEIYGMEDIKKALLLLLVGGVDKNMNDGMKIRGNMNILLMGDPGIAKSQLLKYISHLSPRGVYTTGKGSSGVGLTAAVVKDPVTNDLVLEGGALVLADMGVCCIDEFDKMTDYDRANIHEVMEQQTVSIAKAGITTRLNARTAVLAAANPVYGRYNADRSPHENINLPAALLSRFDLIFLLLDEVKPDRDLELAKHVAYVHQHKEAFMEKSKDNKIYDEEFIRKYIAQAKRLRPIIPQELHNFIVQKYVEKRKMEIQQKDKQGYQYITPRSLLAVLRLSQALAKLRMNDEVRQEDVDEALRLVEVSQSSINKNENKEGLEKFDGITKKNDVKSQIYNIVSDLCKNNEMKTVKIDTIRKKIKAKNFNDKQLENVLKEYVELSILYVDENHTEVTLL